MHSTDEEGSFVARAFHGDAPTVMTDISGIREGEGVRSQGLSADRHHLRPGGSALRRGLGLRRFRLGIPVQSQRLYSYLIVSGMQIPSGSSNCLYRLFPYVFHLSRRVEFIRPMLEAHAVGSNSFDHRRLITTWHPDLVPTGIITDIPSETGSQRIGKDISGIL